MMPRPCNVLLVDDSEDDIYLLKRALAPHNNLRVVAWAEDGNGAIDYLSGTGPYADRKHFTSTRPFNWKHSTASSIACSPSAPRTVRARKP
jgi:CheY-like chemotaxis protein